MMPNGNENVDVGVVIFAGACVVIGALLMIVAEVIRYWQNK